MGEWRHSETRMQWELVDVTRDRVTAFVTDELIRDAALSPEQLGAYLQRRFAGFPVTEALAKVKNPWT